MRLFVKEGCSVDSDKLNFTLGGSETQIDVFTHFEDSDIAAQVDCTHINRVFFDFIEEADQYKTIGHHMEQIVTFSDHGETILDILIVFKVFVPKSGNNVTLFNEISVLSSNSALNSSCVTFSVVSDLTEVFAASFDGLNHVEEFEEIDNTVLIAVVLFEDSVSLFLGEDAVAHVFDHLAELSCLDGSVLVFVVVLESLHDLGAVFSREYFLVLERNSVVRSGVDHIFRFLFN